LSDTDSSLPCHLIAGDHPPAGDDGARRLPQGQRFEWQQGKVQRQPQHG
jgi:hypothetical protein